MGRKKKFVVEIDEKYVHQKNHQIHNRESKRQKNDISFLRRNIKKNCRTFIAKKKGLFSRGGKKKVCKQRKLYPPPDIWGGGGYLFAISDLHLEL